MSDSNDIVNRWRDQPLEESEIDMQKVIEGAARFQGRIRRRNLTEYVACGVVVAWTGSSALDSSEPLIARVSMALLAAGAIVVAAVLRKRGHAASGEPPLAASTREVLGWHRAELTRQRDLLRDVPVWYIGPFVPGVALQLVGDWLASPDQGVYVGLTAALVVAVFVGVALLNLRGARKLDAQIEELGRGVEG
jgi:hypothetical protein